MGLQALIRQWPSCLGFLYIWWWCTYHELFWGGMLEVHQEGCQQLQFSSNTRCPQEAAGSFQNTRALGRFYCHDFRRSRVCYDHSGVMAQGKATSTVDTGLYYFQQPTLS